MGTEIVKTDNQLATTPMDVVQQAVASGMDPDGLEKILAMQERWEANQARKAYVKAMSEFQANPPDIVKDKHVEFITTKGTTQYDHATLAQVARVVGEALREHGLFASWRTGDNNGQPSVTCRITHVDGHFEETTLSAPADASGGKNSIQAIGSTTTYLQRYTILALCGLATRDMDNDGAGAMATIDEKQVSTIVDMIATCGDGAERATLDWLKVGSVEEIPAKDFKRVFAALQAQSKKLAERK